MSGGAGPCVDEGPVVLPPPQPLYLIANNYHQRRDFGFADFLNVTLLGSQWLAHFVHGPVFSYEGQGRP